MPQTRTFETRHQLDSAAAAAPQRVAQLTESVREFGTKVPARAPYVQWLKRAE